MNSRPEQRQMQERVEVETRGRDRPSVLLVTGVHIAAVGLRSLLLDRQGLRLVATVPQGDDALRALKQYQPAVVFVGCDGVSTETLQLLEQLRAHGPGSRIIVFSDDVDYDTLVRVTQVPVDGYLGWMEARTDTIDLILASALAGIWLGATRAVRKLGSPTEQPSPLTVELTPDERSLVDALELGLTTREMREELPWTPRTRQRVMARLLRNFGVRTAYKLGKRMATAHLTQ